MHFLGLRTIIYKVPELEKAKEWYSKILGIAPYFDEPFYIGFNIAGYELGLQPIEENIAPVINNTISYWGVTNVETTYKQLLEHGAKPLEKPTNVGDNIIVAAVKDPWNNSFGIICNPHFKIE